MSVRKCLVGLVGLVSQLVAAVTFVSVAEADIAGRLAFNAPGSSNNYGYAIEVMDLATGTRHVVPTPTDVLNSSPMWSPDGQWLTFQGGVPSNGQICVVKPDGSGYRQVTDGNGNLVYPSFSPDGTRIAYHQVYGSLYTIDSGSDHGNPTSDAIAG